MRQAFLILAIAVAAFAADPSPRPSAPKTLPARVLRVPVSSSEEAVKPTAVKALLMGGKPARVVRVRGSQDDLLILLVMDTVGDLSLVEPARNALIERFQELPGTTWAGLLRAQDGLQVLLDPTPDREKFSVALREMPVTGKAGLLDTVEMAASLADSIGAKSAVRVAILYVTDSDVRNYREDFTNPVINSSDSRDLSRRFPEGLIREKIARLTDTLSRRQTPVFIVHLAYSSERLNEAYQSGLLHLAAATGGSTAFCRSQADIAETIGQTVTSIQQMQQVWVQLPARAAGAVQVALEANGKPLDHRSRFVLK